MIVTQRLYRQMRGAREIADGKRGGHVSSLHSPAGGESSIEPTVDSPATVDPKVFTPAICRAMQEIDPMFDHVMLNVSNRKESMKFYTSALRALGIKVLYDQDEYTAYGADSFHFWLRESEKNDVTRKAHLAFSANSRKEVEGFYQAALAAG
jgi:hypothetical protein